MLLSVTVTVNRRAGRAGRTDEDEGAGSAQEAADLVASLLGLSVTDTEKPRRGRPPLLPPLYLEVLQKTEPQLTTRRSLLNRHYAAQAYSLLEKADPAHERYSWLLGTNAPMGTSSRRGGVRWAILTELGRQLALERAAGVPPTLTLKWADELCAERPRSREAAAMVRWMRTGLEARPPRPGQLVAELRRAVRDFRGRYPETTGQEVVDALEAVIALEGE
jgi:hypothetical protein